jgi:hypothetical protein
MVLHAPIARGEHFVAGSRRQRINVQAKYEDVRRSIQGGMDAFARRRLPLMG